MLCCGIFSSSLPFLSSTLCRRRVRPCANRVQKNLPTHPFGRCRQTREIIDFTQTTTEIPFFARSAAAAVVTQMGHAVSQNEGTPGHSPTQAPSEKDRPTPTERRSNNYRFALLFSRLSLSKAQIQATFRRPGRRAPALGGRGQRRTLGLFWST